MAKVSSFEKARRNDQLASDIAAAADRFRTSGQVGDMVSLRDARVRAGSFITDGASTGWGDSGRTETPEDFFDPGPGELPEVDIRDLSINTLQSAMYHHGALIIRNLLSPGQADHYRRRIDDVIAASKAAFDATEDGAPDDRKANSKSFFLPLGASAGVSRENRHAFLGKSGAIETFLSPRVSSELLDNYERLGLRGLLQSYFHDEVCLSFQKSVLRRAEPLKNPAEWHQDGAFMTEGIQSLNLWLALSECGSGTESPGMDLVPKRLTKVLPTGGNGAIFNWSVSGKTVSEEFPDVQTARPYFAPGDGVFFDHYNLHATSSGDEFSQPRYAIETWFFSKSRSALNQTPVFW